MFLSIFKSVKRSSEKRNKCDLNVDYHLEWEICLKYERSQINYLNILLSKMKAGDTTTISEVLDIYFPFFEYDYPPQNVWLNRNSSIQKGKNEQEWLRI